MKKGRAVALGVLASALAACAAAPEHDQIAQNAMIGLSERAVLACMGQPDRRTRPAERTEIWTYHSGMTAVSTPAWGLGSDFGALGLNQPCDVKVVMTNASVSQVTYRLPDGRALPSGRQCAFAAAPCAFAR